MRRSIWEKIEEILRKHILHGKWVRSIIALSCVVIFITTYLLVMPAVTLSGTPDCGQDEHRHTDDCYETESEEICGLEEHTHADDCYDEDGNLICGLEEHAHNDGCYETEEVLTCGMEEHIHTSDCYNGADAEEADSEDSSSSSEDAGEPESKTEQGEDVTDEVNSEDAESVNAPEAAEPASGSLQAEGEDYTITVSYTEEANLPADVSLKAEEIINTEEYEGYKSQVEEEILDPESQKVTAARFFDITLLDSEDNELHPEKAVTVVIETKDTLKENEELQVCHFDQEQEKPVIVKSQEIINETYKEDNLGVQFEAESFSVYGVVRTKPIGTTVLTADGETYTVTVSYTEEANLPADVSLKVEEITNKEEYEGYKSQVEEEILDSESKKVTAARFFDITLLDSDGNELHPEKAVTVVIETKDTWKENEEIQVCHFDQEQDKPVIVKSQEVINETYRENNLGVQFEAERFSVYGVVGTEAITAHYITAEGDTYTITVTYGPEANIPKDAALEVREVIEGTAEYGKYVDDAVQAMSKPDEADVLTGEDKGKLEKMADTSTGFEARFFDIIIKDSKGNKIEPNNAVTVSIEYDKSISATEGTETKAVHFTEAGDIEIIDTETDGTEDGKSIVSFEQNSFSVTGTITQKLSDNWPADGEYVLILKPENSDKYYAVASSGGILEVKYDAANEKITFENLLDAGQVDAFKWTLSSHSGEDRNFKELKNGSSYIDPYYSDPIRTAADGYLYRDSNGHMRSGYQGGGYVAIDENNMKIVGSSSQAASNTARVFFATDFKLDDSQGEEPGGDHVLGVPDTSKVLKPNGDGTYTLSLSVTGKAEEQTNNSKADVIIVFDRSGSMLFNKNDNNEHNWNKNRRDYIAINAIKELAEDLLDNNTSSDPDKVRLGFVTFGNTAKTEVAISSSRTGASANYNQFATYVDNARGQSGTGTNWDAGLTNALNMSTREGADVYVVFVSDGNPTFWLRDSDGTRRGTGYETTDNIANSYNEAKVVARNIVKAGTEIYSVGVFGNTSRMENLIRYAYTGSDNGELKQGHYQTASDAASLKTAFDDIIQNITKNFEYTNVSFVDDITNYTATVMVDGTADNITVTVKDADGNVTHSEDSHVKPVFNDGTATLQFTDGYSLKKGYTYTASFTVWPTQTAYDRIAALNNGAIFTAEDAANGITYINGQYSLNTNSNAQVNYSTVTRETGKDPVIVPQEPIKNIPCLDEDGNPASIPLGTTGMYFQKVWYVGLQESQFTRMQSWTYDKGEEPLLHVGYKDSSSATPDADLDKTFEVMPIHNNVTKISGEGEPAVYETLREKWAIAPGIMVTTLPEGAQAKATWTFNGTTYYALETGHDYTITEDYISGNFEPVNETYHPMFFGDKLMNVKLDGNTIVSMEEMDPELLTVKNWLRGGINVTKTVKDPEGNVVTSDDTEFQVTITVTAPTADAANYPTWYKDTETTIKQPIKVVWYDTYANAEDLASGTVMYGVNGKPAEGESTGEDNYANNLNYMEFVNGVATKTLTLKAGQTIRVTNLLRNSTYSVTEVKPNGYEVTYDDASGTIASNEEHNVSVINTQTTTEITVLKADSKTKNPIIDANAEFELYLGRNQLYINKTDGSTITVEAYNSLEETEKANYTDRVKVVDGSVGTKLVLTPGTYRLVEKEPPKGYIIATSAVYYKVSNTVELCDESGSVIDSSDGASVSGKNLTIYNTAGQSLPNTGGSGTLPYTLGGLMLIIASALMYGFRMRRRERRLN